MTWISQIFSVPLQFMKDNIKKILRENMEKNALGVVVTRPDQVLIVMRGVSGAGKSTRAKAVVGNGKIHSTDALIEAAGDYHDFFDKLEADKDWSPLSRMHSQNLKNAIADITAGVSPVVIDNMNIRKTDAKAYVVAALELGLADANIKFEDVGTAGLTAEQLTARNAHGVPLEAIEKLIARHKGQGEFTVEAVLKAKDMFKSSDILYSAVVLDRASHNKLVTTHLPIAIPKDWIIYARHMTIIFGKGLPVKEDLGKQVTLRVTHVGISDMAMAVRVEGFPTTNDIPHVTLAVNPEGGKPVMSNQITKWQDVKPFYITGIVSEIKKENPRENEKEG
jgi:predicted kinase